MPESILVDVDDGIGTITLNRPEKLNAWDMPMRAALRRALEQLDADDRGRAIILTGAGDRAFSAGQDLAETQQLTPATPGASGSCRGATSMTPSASWRRRASAPSTASPRARPSRSPC